MLFFESKSEFFKKSFRQKMSQRIKDERTLLSSKVSGQGTKNGGTVPYKMYLILVIDFKI